MTNLVDVGALDDFTPGQMAIVVADGREVGIVRDDDQVVSAILNRCPHMGGPVCQGHLGPKLSADVPGTLEVNSQELVITCGWHHWEFEVRTGKTLSHGRERLKIYPTHVRDGRVLVEMR